MYKKRLLLIIFFILFSQSSFGENNVAYIDLDQILSKSIPSINMFEQIKKKEDIKLNELKKKENDLKDIENNIINTKNIISKEEYNKKVQDFKKDVNEYQKKKNFTIQELKKIRNQEILIFLKLINPIIEEVMKKKSIDILIEKKNIFIAKSNYDITIDVIDDINKNIKKFEIQNKWQD